MYIEIWRCRQNNVLTPTSIDNQSHQLGKHLQIQVSYQAQILKGDVHYGKTTLWEEVHTKCSAVKSRLLYSVTEKNWNQLHHRHIICSMVANNESSKLCKLLETYHMLKLY